MPFLLLLLPLLAKIPGMIGDYFSKVQDIQKIKLETERQIELAKQQLASTIAAGQLELNKTIVQSTGSYFKYFTFFMWFGPFMIGVVYPSASKEIFNNLTLMPEWYVQSCMLIMFTVWGISVSAPVVGNIFSGLSTYLGQRREFKLEKAKIDRKVYFNEFRKLHGPLSQGDVDLLNKSLDEAEKEDN